jgi:hypothetical protein
LRDRSIRPKEKAVAKKRSAGMEQGLMKTRHDTLVAAKEDSTGARSEQGALADFAEDLGRLLGSAERKATTWLDQRKAVGDQLAAIRDKASELLSQLGVSGSTSTPAARRGRRTGAARAAGTRKRAPMSAEAREKIAAAQRRRWAKARRAKGAS